MRKCRQWPRSQIHQLTGLSGVRFAGQESAAGLRRTGRRRRQPNRLPAVRMAFQRRSNQGQWFSVRSQSERQRSRGPKALSGYQKCEQINWKIQLSAFERKRLHFVSKYLFDLNNPWVLLFSTFDVVSFLVHFWCWRFAWCNFHLPILPLNFMFVLFTICFAH